MALGYDDRREAYESGTGAAEAVSRRIQDSVEQYRLAVEQGADVSRSIEGLCVLLGNLGEAEPEPRSLLQNVEGLVRGPGQGGSDAAQLFTDLAWACLERLEQQVNGTAGRQMLQIVAAAVSTGRLARPESVLPGCPPALCQQLCRALLVGDPGPFEGVDVEAISRALGNPHAFSEWQGLLSRFGGRNVDFSVFQPLWLRLLRKLSECADAPRRQQLLACLGVEPAELEDILCSEDGMAADGQDARDRLGRALLADPHVGRELYDLTGIEIERELAESTLSELECGNGEAGCRDLIQLLAAGVRTGRLRDFAEMFVGGVAALSEDRRSGGEAALRAALVKGDVRRFVSPIDRVAMLDALFGPAARSSLETHAADTDGWCEQVRRLRSRYLGEFSRRGSLNPLLLHALRLELDARGSGDRFLASSHLDRVSAVELVRAFYADDPGPFKLELSDDLNGFYLDVLGGKEMPGLAAPDRHELLQAVLQYCRDRLEGAMRTAASRWILDLVCGVLREGRLEGEHFVLDNGVDLGRLMEALASGDAEPFRAVQASSVVRLLRGPQGAALVPDERNRQADIQAMADEHFAMVSPACSKESRDHENSWLRVAWRSLKGSLNAGGTSEEVIEAFLDSDIARLNQIIIPPASWIARDPQRAETGSEPLPERMRRFRRRYLTLTKSTFALLTVAAIIYVVAHKWPKPLPESFEGPSAVREEFRPDAVKLNPLLPRLVPVSAATGSDLIEDPADANTRWKVKYMSSEPLTNGQYEYLVRSSRLSADSRQIIRLDEHRCREYCRRLTTVWKRQFWAEFKDGGPLAGMVFQPLRAEFPSAKSREQHSENGVAWKVGLCARE